MTYWTQQIRLFGIDKPNCYKKLTIKLAIDSANKDSNCKTDLGSKIAWINKCIPSKI